MAAYFSLCIATLGLCASLGAAAQAGFERLYGWTKGEAFNAVVAGANGVIVAAGNTGSTDPLYTDGYVVAVDSQGDTLWTRWFGNAYVEEANAVLETPAGYVVAGVNVPAAPVSYDLYAVLYDGAGNVVWERFFGGAGSEGCLDALRNTNGNLVFCGYTTSFTNGGVDVYVVETDLSGNLVRWAHFGTSGHDVANAIWQTADGGYLLAGYTNATDPWYSMYLLKIDANFNFIWSKELGGTNEEVAFDVAEDSQGSIWVLGFQVSTLDSIRMAVIRTNPNADSAQWFYPAPVGHFGYRLLAHPDGGFLISGLAHHLDLGSQMLLLRLSDTGQPLFSSAFGGDKSDLAFALAPYDSGHVLLAGISEGFGIANADAYLVKTDWQGTIPCPAQLDFLISDPLPCEDQTVFFTNTTISSQAFTWLWNGVPFAQQFHSGIVFPSAGVQHIGLKACTEQLVKEIDVQSKPPTKFTYQAEGTTVFFTMSNIADLSSFEWNFGDGSPVNSTDVHPVHTYAGLGGYWVTLRVVNPAGCDSMYAEYIQLTYLEYNNDPGWHVFPNPARQWLRWSGDAVQPRSVRLLDPLGRHCGSWHNPDNTLALPLLAPGHYVLVFESDQGMRHYVPLLID